MHHSQPTSGGFVSVFEGSDGADRRLLVIGATGFVGRNLRALATRSDWDANFSARDSLSGELACDLLDPGSIRACLRRARPELIVNAAGSASVAASFEDPDASRAVNAAGVESLLEAVAVEAPGAQVVLLSSAQVYGEAGEGELPFREDAPLRPLTPYGEAKAEMEAAAARHAEGGTRVAVARLFNQLGPGLPAVQAASGFARAIAAAEAEGRDRVRVAVANPDTARDFTDVRDTAGALLGIGARGLTGTFNVCSGTAIAIRDVVAALGRATELAVEVEHDRSARRGPEPSASYGDPMRLRAAIGWEPGVPLERSLADLLDWWRAELADAA